MVTRKKKKKRRNGAGILTTQPRKTIKTQHELKTSTAGSVHHTGPRRNTEQRQNPSGDWCKLDVCRWRPQRAPPLPVSVSRGRLECQVTRSRQAARGSHTSRAYTALLHPPALLLLSLSPLLPPGFTLPPLPRLLSFPFPFLILHLSCYLNFLSTSASSSWFGFLSVSFPVFFFFLSHPFFIVHYLHCHLPLSCSSLCVHSSYFYPWRNFIRVFVHPNKSHNFDHSFFCRQHSLGNDKATLKQFKRGGCSAETIMRLEAPPSKGNERMDDFSGHYTIQHKHGDSLFFPSSKRCFCHC